MIAYPDGPDVPHSGPGEIAELLGLDDRDVLLGWTPEDRDWLSDGDLRGLTMLAGYALGGPVRDGRIRYLPVRLSAMPRLLQDVLRPEVAVVTGVLRGATYAFGSNVGWGPAACRAATKGVVVEVDPTGADLGGPPIPGRILATVERPDRGTVVGKARRPDDVEQAIAARVVDALPPEPTIQVGPGAMADAVLGAIDRPVHLWSGLVSDQAAGILDRGLLLGSATAAYTWGGEPLTRLHDAGRLRLVPVEESHDLGRLTAIERFAACNTALQVGLDGSVNVERVGGRQVAGIGGHADFCAGATGSPGGVSIVALRATARDGQSTIVPRVEVVSTARTDVHLVITEYGVADLRGCDDAERGRRLIAVAAPEHRERLQQPN